MVQARLIFHFRFGHLPRSWQIQLSFPFVSFLVVLLSIIYFILFFLFNVLHGLAMTCGCLVVLFSFPFVFSAAKINYFF